jgi:hypothetical protein
MSNRNKLWLGAHLALACDMGIDIAGNEHCASSVLATLKELCPEYVGVEPTKDMLMEFALDTFGWTVDEFNEYAMEN